jgi:cytidylate kinase
MESRIARLMEKRNMDMEEAIRTIEKVDKARENFTRKYADASRYDTHNYDLVVNMDGLTEDDAADIIMAYIERLTANAEKKRS